MDIFQHIVEKESDLVLKNALPYIKAFRAFDEVVGSCFGVSLKGDYLEKIKVFKTMYLSLGISVTPKVHPPPL